MTRMTRNDLGWLGWKGMTRDDYGLLGMTRDNWDESGWLWWQGMTRESWDDKGWLGWLGIPRDDSGFLFLTYGKFLLSLQPEYLFTLNQSVQQELSHMWCSTFEIGGPKSPSLCVNRRPIWYDFILGDPGADKGGQEKSKRAEKYIWNEEK